MVKKAIPILKNKTYTPLIYSILNGFNESRKIKNDIEKEKNNEYKKKRKEYHELKRTNKLALKPEKSDYLSSLSYYSKLLGNLKKENIIESRRTDFNKVEYIINYISIINNINNLIYGEKYSKNLADDESNDILKNIFQKYLEELMDYEKNNHSLKYSLNKESIINRKKTKAIYPYGSFLNCTLLEIIEGFISGLCYYQIENENRKDLNIFEDKVYFYIRKHGLKPYNWLSGISQALFKSKENEISVSNFIKNVKKNN